MSAPDRPSGVSVVRLAFLGAWQHHRPCSWKDAVSSHTEHVLPSRGARAGRQALRRQMDETSGPVDLRIAGYSWGAWTALQLVERLVRTPGRLHPRLAREPFTVRLGLLDPVGVFRRDVALPDDARIRCWNVYQRNGCHRGCPGPSAWYRGRELPGAKNLDVSDEGRDRDESDGVPSEVAPDHIQLGYKGWNGWDARVAGVLAGNEPF